MSDIYVGQTESPRMTCTVCGKRRTCRILILLGVPGLAWFVCREHAAWRPVEGEDYTVEPADDLTRG